MRARKNKSLEFAGHLIPAGNRQLVHLHAGTNLANESVKLSVEVVRGKLEGPSLLITSAIHGDEIIGTEIIRRLLSHPSLSKMKGTLYAVPIVNIPAFMTRMRYLPDRRDLNRLFPGSNKGSLGARLAYTITNTLLPQCDAVIDLHTGAVNRPNLPQLRITENDEESLKLGKAFGAPVTMFSGIRDGSFRGEAAKLKKPFILYEAGEALCLEASSIRFGLQGIISVMREMGMLPKVNKKRKESIFAEKSTWERAPVGGLFTSLVPLGKATTKGLLLGFISSPFSGSKEYPVYASRKGIVIGRNNEGLVDEGDALIHLAVLHDPEAVEDHLQQVHDELPGDPDDHDYDHAAPDNALLS